jgi:hypothetical protein
VSGLRDLPGDYAARIWARDASLWSDDPAVQKSISERLGWLDLPDTMPAQLEAITAFADAAESDGFTQVLVLGMGGSSLAAEVFGDRWHGTRLDVRVCDTTLPTPIRDATAWAREARTLFIVASKSGGTRETMALYRHFRAQFDDGAQFVAITDPGSGLAQLAEQEQFRHTFLAPPAVGGRYSALSVFGLVPAALAGADCAAMLEQARVAADACRKGSPLLDSFVAALLAFEGCIVDFEGFTETPLAGWIEQLVAESTGKSGVGLLPIPVPPDDEEAREDGDDADSEPEQLPEEMAGHATDAGDDIPERVGWQMFMLEFATAVAAIRLGVNPFDQPDVEAAKAAAQAALDDPSKRPTPVCEARGQVCYADAELAAQFETAEGVAPHEVARAHLARLRSRDEFVAVLAFLPPGELAYGAALQLIQGAGGTSLPVAVSFGPRYLHSTGQFHKGGPDAGLYFMSSVEIDAENDLPIPGETATFGQLAVAQAAGDFAALCAAGRRVLWTHLRA